MTKQRAKVPNTSAIKAGSNGCSATTAGAAEIATSKNLDAKAAALAPAI